MTKPPLSAGRERHIDVWVRRDAEDEMRRFQSIIAYARDDILDERVRATLIIPATKAKKRRKS